MHVKVHIWGMGYAGGIQTVVSARNASLPLPALLKSSLAAFPLFEETPDPCLRHVCASKLSSFGLLKRGVTSVNFFHLPHDHSL